MANLSALFAKYDRLVLFDTETTGLQYNRDEIIEFAAVVVEQVNGEKEEPFAEVEVELKEGSDAAAVAFARTLAETFALTEEPLSKFARAMALAMT